jgi:hypothetical protein
MRTHRHRLDRLEERLLPPSGPSVAEILSRRPGEPTPPPLTEAERDAEEEEMLQAGGLVAILVRRMRRARAEDAARALEATP